MRMMRDGFQVEIIRRLTLVGCYRWPEEGSSTKLRGTVCLLVSGVVKIYKEEIDS